MDISNLPGQNIVIESFSNIIPYSSPSVFDKKTDFTHWNGGTNNIVGLSSALLQGAFWAQLEDEPGIGTWLLLSPADWDYVTISGQRPDITQTDIDTFNRSNIVSGITESVTSFLPESIKDFFNKAGTYAKYSLLAVLGLIVLWLIYKLYKILK